MTPEELAAEKAAQEAKEKAEKEAKEKETPQSLEMALNELARARDALTAANHEAAERRKKLSAFEAAEEKRAAEEKKRREAEMSEAEKLKTQMAELADRHAKADAELRDLKLRQAIRQAAGKAKVLWASEVAELDAIEILARGATLDDSGNPKGLDEQIKALQKEREYLFRKGTPPPNINADANSKGNPSAEERVKALRQRFPSIKS